MKDHVIKGILWLGSASIITQAVTWLSTILVARLLSPADYGLIGLAGIYIGFAEQVNEFGIGTAIIQRKDLREQDIKGIYTISIMIGVAMTTLTFFLAPAFASFFKEVRLTDIIRLLSFTFLINSAKSVQRNLMVRDMRFAELAKMTGGAHILTSLSTLVLACTGFGVWALVIQYLLRNLILFIWAFLYERRLPGKIKEFSRLKEMLSFGAGVSGSNLLFSIIRNIDSLIVGKLLGKITLGYYSFAQVLADKPFEKVLSVFSQVFLPVFSKIQDDHIKRKQYFFRILQLEILILTPVFVTLILVAPELVHVVLGNKWQLMVVPLQLFAGIAIFKYIENRVNIMFNSSGNSRPQFIYMATLVPIMAASLFAGAKFFGMNGVLTVWGVSYPIVFVFYLRYFLLYYDIKLLSFLSIWKVPAISTSAMVIAVFLFSLHPSPNEFISLFIKAIITLIIYLVINYFLNKKVGRVKILFSYFSNIFLSRPKIIDVLPVMPESQDVDKISDAFIFEPSLDSVLKFLLKRYIENTIYQSLLESFLSEQASRMIAMQNATNNAKDIIYELTLEYNKARQEKITNEILDISSASNILL